MEPDPPHGGAPLDGRVAMVEEEPDLLRLGVPQIPPVIPERTARVGAGVVVESCGDPCVAGDRRQTLHVRLDPGKMAGTIVETA